VINDKDIYCYELSNAYFNKFSSFIYKECGISYPPDKKILLEGRLRRRIKALNMLEYEEYYNYLISPDGIENELIFFINVVTTNKTDFFREPAHFNYLKDNLLPQLYADGGSRYRSSFSTWSAGCSSGEEPYTLAIVMEEFKRQYSSFNYEVFASDISSDVLHCAVKGVYPEDSLIDVDISFKKKYFLKSKAPGSRLVRVVPELRDRINFFRLNLMDKVYNVPKKFNAIFCRNVIIYFDKKTQEEVLNRFASNLLPDGYLFLGHSETITGLNTPFTRISSTIYQLKQRV